MMGSAFDGYLPNDFDDIGDDGDQSGSHAGFLRHKDNPSRPKEATTAQHFALPKGQPARFVRNGILEVCECRDCTQLSDTHRPEGS